MFLNFIIEKLNFCYEEEGMIVTLVALLKKLKPKQLL